ncbi:MAG: hypothetical protein RLY24_803, partial [Actinomycetota bacterium]
STDGCNEKRTQHPQQHRNAVNGDSVLKDAVQEDSKVRNKSYATKGSGCVCFPDHGGNVMTVMIRVLGAQELLQGARDIRHLHSSLTVALLQRRQVLQRQRCLRQMQWLATHC